jgi:hypothetical protein
MIGYVSMAVALGGYDKFVSFVLTAAAGLNPTASDAGLWSRLVFSGWMTDLALSNVGNELMIFSTPLVERSHWRGWVFLSVNAILLGQGIYNKLCGQSFVNVRTFPVMIVISYLAMTLLFGNRLWVHHFSIMVPLFYLLATVMLSPITSWTARSYRFLAPILLAGGILAVNLSHQAIFFAGLDRTGGVGRASSAMTRMAEQALEEGNVGSNLYVFPEWGHLMPFALLTKNRIPYQVELTEGAMKADQYSHIRIASWTQTGAANYASQLTRHGVQDVRVDVRYQRDGVPAFYLVSGRLH